MGGRDDLGPPCHHLSKSRRKPPLRANVANLSSGAKRWPRALPDVDRLVLTGPVRSAVDHIGAASGHDSLLRRRGGSLGACHAVRPAARVLPSSVSNRGSLAMRTRSMGATTYVNHPPFTTGGSEIGRKSYWVARHIRRAPEKTPGGATRPPALRQGHPGRHGGAEAPPPSPGPQSDRRRAAVHRGCRPAGPLGPRGLRGSTKEHSPTRVTTWGGD